MRSCFAVVRPRAHGSCVSVCMQCRESGLYGRGGTHVCALSRAATDNGNERVRALAEEFYVFFLSAPLSLFRFFFFFRSRSLVVARPAGCGRDFMLLAFLYLHTSWLGGQSRRSLEILYLPKMLLWRVLTSICNGGVCIQGFYDVENVDWPSYWERNMAVERCLYLSPILATVKQIFRRILLLWRYWSINLITRSNARTYLQY